VSAGELAALKESMARLQNDVEELQRTVARLCAERDLPQREK